MGNRKIPDHIDEMIQEGTTGIGITFKDIDDIFGEIGLGPSFETRVERFVESIDIPPPDAKGFTPEASTRHPNDVDPLDYIEPDDEPGEEDEVEHPISRSPLKPRHSSD